jgi:hypothetical protein
MNDGLPNLFSSSSSFLLCAHPTVGHHVHTRHSPTLHTQLIILHVQDGQGGRVISSSPSGDAHGHGPYPIINGERTLLSAWLKQGRGWLKQGRLSLTDFLLEDEK